MKDTEKKLLLDVISHQIRLFDGYANQEGCGVSLRRVQNLLGDILNSVTDDAELAGVERFFAFYTSTLMTAIRLELFMSLTAKSIDNNNIIDDDMKNGLKLVFRTIDIDDVSFFGHIIDAKKLTEKVSIISELAPDALEQLINDIKRSYKDLLFTKYANRVNNFLNNIAEKFASNDLSGAYDLLKEEILQLNLENNKCVHKHLLG
jgi:hypothetical protein